MYQLRGGCSLYQLIYSRIKYRHFVNWQVISRFDIGIVNISGAQQTRPNCCLSRSKTAVNEHNSSHQLRPCSAIERIRVLLEPEIKFPELCNSKSDCGSQYQLNTFSISIYKFASVGILRYYRLGQHHVVRALSCYGVVRYRMILSLMTSSNGNIFRVTGHLCGEFTGPRWIPRSNASDAELWCFLWSASE